MAGASPFGQAPAQIYAPANIPRGASTLGDRSVTPTSFEGRWNISLYAPKKQLRRPNLMMLNIMFYAPRRFRHISFDVVKYCVFMHATELGPNNVRRAPKSVRDFPY